MHLKLADVLAMGTFQLDGDIGSLVPVRVFEI